MKNRYCHNCGKQLTSQVANFCPFCGTALESSAYEREDDEKDVIDAPISKIEADPLPEDAVDRFKYKQDDYVYARLMSINPDNNMYHFKAIDNIVSFYLPENILKNCGYQNLRKNDYIWVCLREARGNRNWRVNLTTDKNSGLTRELASFTKHFHINDVILAPIIKRDSQKIVVAIGPNATVWVYLSTFPSYLDKDEFVEGAIKPFVITNIEQDSSHKVKVFLQPIVEFLKEDIKKWRDLPENLTPQKVLFPRKTLDKIYENEDVRLAINKWASEKKIYNDGQKVRRFLQERYNTEYEHRRVLSQYKEDTHYMDFSLGIFDKKGVPLSAMFKKKRNDKWVLSMVGFSSAERELEKYVFIKDWKNLLDELNALALPEEWDIPSEKEKGERFMLKSYLRFAFFKSKLDKLIYKENEEAVFNTGLVDESYSDIYCYLKPNNIEADFYRRPWQFGYFACKGIGEKGKELNRKFSKFPDSPRYIDINRLSDIYFNYEKDLSCDFNHIIRDNIDRLPLAFILSCLSFKPEIISLKDSIKDEKELRLELKKRICNESSVEGGELRRYLVEGLEKSVKTAKKYCKWNYKTAIPIYYPRNNSISLLLPLKLRTSEKTPADVALVVERLENGNYQGQTILSLSMAYQDARQICRPNSEWLTLREIQSIDSADEEE